MGGEIWLSSYEIRVASHVNFSPLLWKRHSEAPRFHQRGEESRVEAEILWYYQNQPHVARRDD